MPGPVTPLSGGFPHKGEVVHILSPFLRAVFARHMVPQPRTSCGRRVFLPPFSLFPPRLPRPSVTTNNVLFALRRGNGPLRRPSRRNPCSTTPPPRSNPTAPTPAPPHPPPPKGTSITGNPHARNQKSSQRCRRGPLPGWGCRSRCLRCCLPASSPRLPSLEPRQWQQPRQAVGLRVPPGRPR